MNRRGLLSSLFAMPIAAAATPLLALGAAQRSFATAGVVASGLCTIGERACEVVLSRGRVEGWTVVPPGATHSDFICTPAQLDRLAADVARAA